MSTVKKYSIVPVTFCGRLRFELHEHRADKKGLRVVYSCKFPSRKEAEEWMLQIVKENHYSEKEHITYYNERGAQI